MSHVMRKPVYAICKKRRRRSVCASTKAQIRLPIIWYFKPLASFCGCIGRFESYLVANSWRQVFSCGGSYVTSVHTLIASSALSHLFLEWWENLWHHNILSKSMNKCKSLNRKLLPSNGNNFRLHILVYMWKYMSNFTYLQNGIVHMLSNY